MELFRLTYGVCSKGVESIDDVSPEDKFEVLGSAEAVFDLYKRLMTTTDQTKYPCFIDIRMLNGYSCLADLRKYGLQGLTMQYHPFK